MTDYIERDIWKSLPDDLPYKASVKRVLMQAQAADVRPVVRGEWVNRAYAAGWIDFCGCYGCSACNSTWDEKSHYCPNCGAEMREAEG